MSGTEFQKAFGTELRQYDSRLILEEEDVFYWLNLAQNGLIREAFSVFEAEAVVTPILRPLQRTEEAEADPGYQTVSGGYTASLFPFPVDCQYVLSVQAGVTKSEVYLWRLCRIAQNDDIYRLLLDPFNRSTFQRPLASFGKEVARVYTNASFGVTKVLFDYIVAPPDISRDGGCVLPEFIHSDIVHKSITLYMSNQAGPAKKKKNPVSPTSSN